MKFRVSVSGLGFEVEGDLGAPGTVAKECSRLLLKSFN